MRVALVSEHASPLALLGGVDAGGQNVHVASLARELGSAGVEVDVYTRRDDASLQSCVALTPRVRVIHVDAGPAGPVPKDELLPYMDAFATELRRLWHRQRPDVVHSHFWMSAYAALAAADGLDIPVAHTFHALGVVKRRYQGEQDTSPESRIEIERDIAHRVDRMVATCTDEVFELLRLGADTSRVAVIPSGVDLDLFTPAGGAEPRKSELRRLVYVGRLVQRKGIGNIISALPALPEAELVIAGGPEQRSLAGDPEAQRLRVLAEELGVADRVDLRGRLPHDELPRLLRSADALVSVPWYEPFGIAPLEAMACGVPVVASAVGGMIDTVLDGVTGSHVAPRDPERLASALRALLGDEERCRAFGRAGAERARRLYDWHRVGGATLELYRGLVRRELTPVSRRRAERAASRNHFAELRDSLDRLERDVERLVAWGERLSTALCNGHRLLVAGNGGSAAEAQHLTAELVGRFECDREPLSAICLHADSSTFTAIVNDYGAEQSFARQVRAHGRAGDVLLALSTSGRSANVLAAVAAARETGLTTWALTGERPNALADAADEAVCAPASRAATVQEIHLVAVHLLCGAVERRLERSNGTAHLSAWGAAP